MVAIWNYLREKTFLWLFLGQNETSRQELQEDERYLLAGENGMPEEQGLSVPRPPSGMKGALH